MTPSRLTAPEGCGTPKSVWVAQVEVNGLKKSERKSMGAYGGGSRSGGRWGKGGNERNTLCEILKN